MSVSTGGSWSRSLLPGNNLSWDIPHLLGPRCVPSCFLGFWPAENSHRVFLLLLRERARVCANVHLQKWLAECPAWGVKPFLDVKGIIREKFTTVFITEVIRNHLKRACWQRHLFQRATCAVSEPDLLKELCKSDNVANAAHTISAERN